MNLISKTLIGIFFFSQALLLMSANPPRIGYVYPAGGEKGTTFEVTVGGIHILEMKSAVISGDGVSVSIISESAEEMKKKKGKAGNNAISETVRLKVSIEPKAAEGIREIRVGTEGGISNKLIFRIGNIPEYVDTEPNDKPEQARFIPALPALLNGQIMQGDLDKFKFAAKKGQKIVVDAAARRIIPYIADAVPGWFHVNLAVYDLKGNELAYADNFKYQQDPVLFFDVPYDGDYILEIRDSIYRGREDFVYRVTIGELPFITRIHPLGARAGKTPVDVKLFGWNLSKDTMKVNVDKEAPSIEKISVENKNLHSNEVFFAVGDCPEINAAKAADLKGEPQKVTLPVTINGCIEKATEVRAFSFDGKKGQWIAVEVMARRLGSMLDSKIALFNSKGEKLKESDDQKDIKEGFLTHHADSMFTHGLSADDTYTVKLSDVQCGAGDDYEFRLKIAPPVPDFGLLALPSHVTVPKGASAVITVQVQRQNGFNGEIKITAKDANSGVVLGGGTIPEGSSRIRMTISAKTDAEEGISDLALEGLATINSKTVRREVVCAEDHTQAFSYHHMVRAEDEAVMVTPPQAFSIEMELPENGAIELLPGKDISIPVKVLRQPGSEYPVQIKLEGPPKGISITKGASIPLEKDEGILVIKADQSVNVNLKDNLILSAVAQIETVPKETPAPPAPEKTTEATKIQENKEKTPDTGNNSADKNVKPDNSGKVTKKERVSVTLPAVPLRIIKPPTEKDKK